MRDHVAVRSGRSYRVASPPENGRMTRGLATGLEYVLEKFALEAGFDEQNPVSIFFKPGLFGHHRVGRAADIYAVGGVGIGEWKARWDRALTRARQACDPRER